MSTIDWDVVDQMLEQIAFFVDTNDKYALFAEYMKHNNVHQFHPVDSQDFEVTLRMWYRALSAARSVPNVKDIIRYIKDEGIYYEDLVEVEPYCRVAGNLHDGIEYFLADKSRTVIRVSNGRWGVANDPAHKFLTTSSHLPQVMPQISDKNIFDLLRPCFNLDGDDLVLFVIWLIQGFSSGSHYGAMLSAERGSGKSTLTRTTNLLLDPSKADTTIMQTKLDDFQNFLGNHYLACFDNVRTIPTDYSDTMAAAITGGIVAKRKLYSDHDMVYLRLHNVVLLNGIDVFPAESDLAERFLYFRLKKIPSTKLKTDLDIQKYVLENRAQILGCVFNALARATKEIHHAKPKKPTRMANAYEEMLAIAKALDISESEFHRIITENTNALHQACAATPLVEAVCEYMNGPARGQRKFSCSSTNFFNRVRVNYSGPRAALPGRAAEFSKQLKREHDGLFAAGFQSIIDDTGSAESTITIIREKK